MYMICAMNYIDGRYPLFVLIDVSNHELQERFEQVAEVLTANLYSYKGFHSAYLL